jgi:hypothetical protein
MADERLAGSRRITLGGNKDYDTRDFVASCRELKVTAAEKGGLSHEKRNPVLGGNRNRLLGSLHYRPVVPVPIVGKRRAKSFLQFGLVGISIDRQTPRALGLVGFG